MPMTECRCGNPQCMYAEHADAIEKFCTHNSMTLSRDVVDDEGRLVAPISMMELARIVAEHAGVPAFWPFVQRLDNHRMAMALGDIEDVGLYAIRVDAGGGRQYHMNVWIVPSNGDSGSVECHYYEEGSPVIQPSMACGDFPSPPPALLTKRQLAALAWAIGSLAGKSDPCGFVSALTELVFQNGGDS